MSLNSSQKEFLETAARRLEGHRNHLAEVDACGEEPRHLASRHRLTTLVSELRRLLEEPDGDAFESLQSQVRGLCQELGIEEVFAES